MDALVLIGLAAVAVFIVLYASRPRTRDFTPSKSAELPAHPPVPRVLSEEEKLAAEAAEVRRQWQRKLNEVEEAHENEMQPIQERLEKARGIVSKSGVGAGACDVLGMWGQWPSLAQSGNGQTPAFGPLDQGRTPRDSHGGREGTWLAWTMDGVPYRLELTVGANYTGGNSDIGDLRLWEKDELVMHLDVAHRIDREFAPWTVFGVSALRAGPWMSRLNELAGRLCIADGQWRRDHDKNFYGGKAKNIELD